MKRVFASGVFDDLYATQVQFLEAAARLGELHIQLWSDVAAARLVNGQPPKFWQDERLYILQAIRYITSLEMSDSLAGPDELDLSHDKPDVWAVMPEQANPRKQAFCDRHHIQYQVIAAGQAGESAFPAAAPLPKPTGRKKIIVTGCFDYLHSGHIRFFEEVSQLGELYVAVGHDANIRLLKGAGHPMFPAAVRRYLVQAIRYVTQAVITTGDGWMDAAPEIEQIRPDAYAVNEDGDKPEKRQFCQEHGLEYIVLQRAPKAGLPKRASTALRGF